MRCSRCGFENPLEMKFCGQCTAALPLICPKCHFENPAGFKFCGQCTAALEPPGAGPETRRPSVALREPDDAAAIEGERKTVTALFADIKGSTEMMEDLDPEKARAIIDPALTLMMDAVHHFDGYVVQSTGDGIFALFGAPLAHEDHPQRALYAALRMQEELHHYGAKLQAEGHSPVEIRVGVDTGEVVVRSIATGATQIEYAPIGHTTNLASRLQSVARTGSVVASETTRKLCEGYFILKPLGATRVKGVSKPVNVYEVIGRGSLRTRLQRSAGRGYTKFVGRNLEMEAMKAAAERAKAGHGQIVASMAEAGVGKSRMIFEFKATSAAGWMVLEAFSVSHGKASSYLTVIDLLQGYFKIASQDDQRTRREKIAGRIAILDRTLEDAIPYLYSLLGIAGESDPLAQMDPQTRRRGTLDAIKRILLRESLNQPLMVIFEDLHWIDEATQALLNLLADSIGTAKILLLVNYRPEYSHQWSSKTYYTQLRLDPLGKESAAEMLQSLLGDSAELVPLKRLIIEKTEGNPFFMEETVEVLLDDGALVRNGRIKLVKSLAELKIPPTVQAILASRIDRLPPDEKDLLQTLAVIGREFALGLLRVVVSKSDDELERMLHNLQLAEFIYEQPAAGDVEYTFKHALTHDVAYNSLLIERRKLLHERMGAAMETLYRERLDDYLAELAHHYVHSTNTRKAVEYLYLAGRQAGKRSVFSEAISRFEAALELLDKLPGDEERSQKELALNIDLGLSVFAARGWASPEAEHIYSRSLELARRVGSDIDLCRALIGLQTLFLFRGQLERARQLGEESVELAQRIGRPGLIIEAHRALGHALWDLSEYSSARAHYEVAISVPTSDSAVPAGKTIATWASGWFFSRSVIPTKPRGR